MTERFTRVSDTQLRYQATVNDPKTWTRAVDLRIAADARRRLGMYEYACHEGNYSMFNILSGAPGRREGSGGGRAKGTMT